MRPKDYRPDMKVQVGYVNNFTEAKLSGKLATPRKGVTVGESWYDNGTRQTVCHVLLDGQTQPVQYPLVRLIEITTSQSSTHTE